MGIEQLQAQNVLDNANDVAKLIDKKALDNLFDDKLIDNLNSMPSGTEVKDTAMKNFFVNYINKVSGISRVTLNNCTIKKDGDDFIVEEPIKAHISIDNKVMTITSLNENNPFYNTVIDLNEDPYYTAPENKVKTYNLNKAQPFYYDGSFTNDSIIRKVNNKNTSEQYKLEFLNLLAGGSNSEYPKLIDDINNGNIDTKTIHIEHGGERGKKGEYYIIKYKDLNDKEKNNKIEEFTIKRPDQGAESL